MSRDELLAALLRERFGPDAAYRPAPRPQLANSPSTPDEPEEADPMPAPRPTMGLHNLSRTPAKNANQHRTTCKLCPDGVYSGQPAVWLTNPMGLSHTECAQRAGIAVPA